MRAFYGCGWPSTAEPKQFPPYLLNSRRQSLLRASQMSLSVSGAPALGIKSK
jgi:hypothetical protein